MVGSERDAMSIIHTNTHGQGVSAEVCRVWLASEKESSQRESDKRKRRGCAEGGVGVDM